MLIKYCVTSANNPLYKSEYRNNKRYQTFGQHSFIADFISAMKRSRCVVELMIEGKESFPLYDSISENCIVTEFRSRVHSLNEADAVILDKLSNEAIDMIVTQSPTFTILHDAGERLNSKLIGISQRIICMTETALAVQAGYIGKEKLMLCPQGVDVTRFLPGLERPVNKGNRIKVLYFTRLIAAKKKTVFAVLDELLKQAGKYKITVLGDGDFFWEASNKYGSKITVINHIPCNSIHTFLPEFDVVISSARGVMEACASGIPVLCAGYGYAGIVTEENIPRLMIRNLTGFGEAENIAGIHKDIDSALSMGAIYWRHLGIKYFNIDVFLKKIISETQSIRSGKEIPKRTVA